MGPLTVNLKIQYNLFRMVIATSSISGPKVLSSYLLKLILKAYFQKVDVENSFK